MSVRVCSSSKRWFYAFGPLYLVATTTFFEIVAVAGVTVVACPLPQASCGFTTETFRCAAFIFGVAHQAPPLFRGRSARRIEFAVTAPLSTRLFGALPFARVGNFSFVTSAHRAPPCILSRVEHTTQKNTIVILCWEKIVEKNDL